MTTMTIDKFELMDNQELAAVEGGKSKVGLGEFAGALAVCTGSGAIAGSAVPVVGTAAGAILGAQYCTGAWAIARSV